MNPPQILIVDDEDRIGRFAEIFLNRAGYKTVRVSSPIEALELFTPEIDLLLTDWTMPSLTGGELAARLLERKPTLRVLIMSGNAFPPTEPEFPLELGANLIPKPFGGEELVSIVRKALEGMHETAPVE